VPEFERPALAIATTLAVARTTTADAIRSSFLKSGSLSAAGARAQA
jgi:hypothetical protein